jgi:uncharacterized protein (TIGR03437 family)
MLTTRLAVLAIATAFATAIPAQNLLVNGSFEQGPNPGSYTNIPQGSTVITGWTVSVGNIDYVGSLWVAEDGSRSLDLEGSSGTCDLVTPNCPGGIAQSFSTVAGQQYTVTFYLAGNPFAAPVVKTILVSAAGQSQTYTFDTTGFGPGNMGWAQVTWNFTANDTTTTLELDSADMPATGYGPTLDNVSVVPSVGGPTISANGLVNGASFQPGIVANSLATIFGASLTTFTDTWDSGIVDGQFPTMVDDVTLTVGGLPAYPDYISPGQINFVVPDVAPGPQDVIVTNSVGSSAAFSAMVSQYGPAFFGWPNNQVVATRQDFSLAAQAGTFPGVTTVPAAPGDVIILWGVGFGPTTPTPPTGVETPSDQLYSASSLPTVTVNNIPATVYGAALAPGFAPLYQVAIQVPTSLADGNWQVLASIGGVTSPAGMVLTVQQ